MMATSTINSEKKTIIFDFGNVLINLDFEKCFDAYEQLIGTRWSMENMPIEITSAVQKYDRGFISDEAFLWVFQQYSESSDPRAFIAAWNSLLGGIKKKRFEMLERLRPDYNLVILSNINNLHLRKIHLYLKKVYQITDFEDRYFDYVFYSHLIGMRKPDIEIYQHVTTTLNIDKSDILFIDDLAENIAAAESFGWHGQVHNPNDEIADKIDGYLTRLD
jgi:putative hydrolase of the HAD superfamily